VLKLELTHLHQVMALAIFDGVLLHILNTLAPATWQVLLRVLCLCLIAGLAWQVLQVACHAGLAWQVLQDLSDCRSCMADLAGLAPCPLSLSLSDSLSASLCAAR
jgi:hypothetical protein